ncbi:hypothetical protein B5F29_06380 [Lachnoclostridium sp. An196]|uniref:COG1361 S-layer family protein n=1 Tax=Lachnoclostridium sp. An196 TaxID=1965583 RepID=UPI000B36EBED|nr:hypothetical protein [Lachnoclostridium sp. An196]OUP20284.1 hypothetical protein B5F29_06380 [Lachnoclostridium sp. An196]
MRKRVMSGILAVVCAAMILGTGVSMAPMQEVYAAQENGNNQSQNEDDDGNTTTTNPEQDLENAKNSAMGTLQDYQRLIDPDGKKSAQLNDVITKAMNQINAMTTVAGVNDYIAKAKDQMDNVVNPPSDNTDEEEEEEPAPANADHFLMVGGNWVTPVANAGQTVSIVLPVVNMGKTMVTDAVVTPVLSTDTAVWPFEITSSSYSQTISDLPGTDTGASDMDRRRELTWNLQTRTDVGTGYQKISFDVRYRDSQGNSQSTTLDTYIQVNGTAGVGADGQASVPRVIVTGFDTNPAEVHAGESFTLTLHLKNTSTATSVNNMICEIVAAVEGKDEETTYAAFLPTAGSSTIFVDKIEKNGTKDISLELEAKADLSQKPYAVDVNMSYEDEKVNSYTNKTSVSIPVKQEARVEVSEPEVMPASIEVGGESNVMFNIYNMGKTKLYNVQVKTVSDFLSGGDAFIGNLDSGATGAVDIYLMGQAATTDDGMVTLQISYEDETGETTTIEREISLFVSETSYDDMIYDDSMMMDDMNQNQGGSTMRTILIVVGILLLIAVIAVVVILRRRKKKEQKSLEDDILDLDQEEEGEDDEIS